jgi:hypothetical protein
VLKRARIRALEQGTSVNAILTERLRAFTGEGGFHARVAQALIALADENSRHTRQTVTARRRVRRWSRDDLHER